MNFLALPFMNECYRYAIFFSNGISDDLNFISNSTTEKCELLGSSRFYISEDGCILGKVTSDKYSRTNHPIKWLLHDYMEKRLLLQADAAKEYRSLMTLRRAGLRTPRCYGWGVSFQPGNSGGSLLLMEHVQGARPGGDVFDTMTEAERLVFLSRFSQEVALLAKAGFVHRDLHYNNLLLDGNDNIIWIDAHVRRLPRRKSLHWSAIHHSLTVDKLRGENYRAFVELQLNKWLSV